MLTKLLHGALVSARNQTGFKLELTLGQGLININVFSVCVEIETPDSKFPTSAYDPVLILSPSFGVKRHKLKLNVFFLIHIFCWTLHLGGFIVFPSIALTYHTNKISIFCQVMSLQLVSFNFLLKVYLIEPDQYGHFGCYRY